MTPVERHDTQMDARDVLAAIERMTRAFEAADIEAVMSAYEPGAAIAFQPGAAISDEAAVRSTFAEWFALAPTFEYAAHEVLVAGDLAVHLAPWKMKGTAPDGSTIEQEGLSVAVLRRQPDGRWLMAIDNPHGQRLLSSGQ